MKEIKVGTINVQNNRINRTTGITDDGFNTAEILGDFIENSGFYFLGTQELTKVFSSNLINNLKKYKLYGGYRYPEGLNIIPMINDFNESNAVVTSECVKTVKTNSLPWIAHNPIELFNCISHGSIMPRIVTIAEIENEYGNIYAMNTHLDYQSKEIQSRQLKSIYKVMESLCEQYPVILTGDFNMEVREDYCFDEFVDKLSSLGYKRVPVSDKTNASKFPNKSSIDHIFVPMKWIVTECGLIENKDLSKVTDHKGVYAKLKIR